MRRPIGATISRPEVTDAIGVALLSGAVTLYEDANFGGRSKALGPGEYRFFMPEDFNDVVSSIQVPSGLCAVLYEHADEGGGYGISVDLLEDCSDLSVYGFNDKVSYINVFPATKSMEVRDHRGGSTTTSFREFIYVRNRLVNGEFIPGHWERPRVGGNPVNAPPAVVSPPYPPHMPTAPTVLQVDGAQTIITFLGVQAGWDNVRWEHAVAEQMGVIGSDFRGVEDIGSAAFQRASNNRAIPDNLNFWYPQKQPRDHRASPYFKRTLVGKVHHAKVVDVPGTYQDFDVCTHVIPNEKYMYLVTEGHSREYTDLMSLQWNLSLHQSGKPNCDTPKDIADAGMVEAEIQPHSDPHSGVAQRLLDMILTRSGQDIGIYGPWIFDKGHCCHSEIHPAEQIWWRDDVSTAQRRYTFCVFCDASKRFWWRDQMDDGTKLKPWGAPPIRGLFAIAFEVELGKPAVKFEVANIDHYNVVDVPNGNQVYNLVYQNNVLVTFIPNNDAFKVTYESVGLTSTNKVRGFLVLETTVGNVTQTRTKLSIPNTNPRFPPLTVKIPPGTDVNGIDQRFERQVFKKEEGRYMFTVTQADPQASVGRGGIWASDFLNVELHVTPTPIPVL
ncbi:hypothetical protein AAII07_52035 [Microvirga sp. 0TCS3.31]